MLQDRRMIHIRDRTRLALTFRRRGGRWWTHNGSVHRAGHDIFYKRYHLFRDGNVGQDAHRADDLTEDEKDYEPDGLRIHS